jgi:O-antigen/teichoic acid export membrane protein
MTAGVTRILACLLLFGLGAEALGGGVVGVIFSALIAIFVNAYWRELQRRRFVREHVEAVDRDEALRRP